MLNSTTGLGATVRHGTDGALKRAKDGSPLKKRYKAAELRSKIAELKVQLSLRKPDHEIQEMLEVSTGTYNELKKELYRQETAELYRQSTEDVYLEYKWQQSQCITELTEMIATFKETAQYNAMVGAIRTKSDIIDKIVKVGQEMGILEHAPERKLVLHGVAVATMDNANLRKLIANEMQGLVSVVQKYGDRNLLGEAVIPLKAPDELESAQPDAGPQFTAMGKPGISKGGADKVAAGKKRGVMNRVKAVAP